MLKSVMTCFWVVVLFWGSIQVCSSEDLEDRFISPDMLSSKSIFINVKDASLVNVLEIISKQSNLSFIASSDVADKKITLYLNKVPLSQALQTVLDANGLAYEMQGDSNVFVVKEKEKTAKNMITKVFLLKYATVSASKLNSTISLGGAATGAAAGGMEQVIKDAMSPDGKVVEDTRTNSLIITDVPGQFVSIENTIAKLDVPIPQILIEVEILDVSKSTGDSLGITYGATPLTFTGGVYNSNFPFGHYEGIVPGPKAGGSTSSSSSSSSSSGSGSGSTPSPAWNANGMTAALNFIANTTDARTLARPKILTLNNETAQIQISLDQAISIQQTATSTTSSSSSTSFTPERYTTGVILKVTPQANLLTREVTMAVSPKFIDVILSLVQPPAGSAQGSIYDPQTSGSDSILKLKDGQSMVIGGLMRTDTSKQVTKLPFLGDLPLIGAAFRSTNRSKSERELIIFLTPHIIDDTDQTALKEDDSSSLSAEASLDIQDAENHAQEINNSLNTYEAK